MPPYVVLAALAVVLSVPVLWVTLAGERTSSRRVNRNLTVGLAPVTDLRRLDLSRPATARAVRPAVGLLARAVRRVTPAGIVTALERRLRISDVSWSLDAVLAAKAGTAFVGALGGALWTLASPSLTTVAVTVLAAGGGFVMPDTVLQRRARARQNAILKALPDTLDQITIAVEAGLGLEAALARVGKTGEGPLAVELVRMLREVQVGVPRADALANVVARTEVSELRQFIHAMGRAEAYGVPVGQVLRIQADELREKRRQRAEERAMKVAVKLVFPLVFCILPALFIVVLGPSAIRTFRAL